MESCARVEMLSAAWSNNRISANTDRRRPRDMKRGIGLLHC
jgi:hypothetical protein